MRTVVISSHSYLGRLVLLVALLLLLPQVLLVLQVLDGVGTSLVLLLPEVLVVESGVGQVDVAAAAAAAASAAVAGAVGVEGGGGGGAVAATVHGPGRGFVEDLCVCVGVGGNLARKYGCVRMRVERPLSCIM